MNVPGLTAATWPPDPDLRANRRLLRLLDGLTDLLDATGTGYALLGQLLARLDQQPAADTLAALGDIDRVLVPFTDTAALLALAQPLDHIHIRLRDACRQRTDVLCRLRRLVDLHQMGLPPTLAHTRAVVHDVHALLDHAGQTLAHIDQRLVAALESTRDQEVPTTVRHTSRHPHPGTDQGISVSDAGEFRRAASEVDESYVGGEEEGVAGRLTHKKAIVAIALEIKHPRGYGRVRLRRIPDVKAASLMPFVRDVVLPDAVVLTDGWQGYAPLARHGYTHKATSIKASGDPAHVVMPGVHRVASLLKRWLLGTHQGAVRRDHLDAYLDEYTFRFNRRTSRSRGLLFYRLLEQAVVTAPAPYGDIIARDLDPKM